jgi:hypothetical protein
MMLLYDLKDIQNKLNDIQYKYECEAILYKNIDRDLNKIKDMWNNNSDYWYYKSKKVFQNIVNDKLMEYEFIKVRVISLCKKYEKMKIIYRTKTMENCEKIYEYHNIPNDIYNYTLQFI